MKKEKTKTRLVKIYMVGNNHPISTRISESTLSTYIVELSQNLQNQKNDLGVAQSWLINNAMISHIRVYKR